MAQPEPGPSSAPVEIAEIDEDEAFKVHFESNDPRNPKSFHPLYKAWLVFLMGLLAMTGALGSSIISPGSAQIADYTHVKREVTSLTVALFILGWAFGPMIWAPISEVYGRRAGMLPAMFVLALLSVGTATSTSAASILLTRFVGGIFASAPISNVPAALGDVFTPATRGNAMTFVSLCITGGPTLGPIIGSALTAHPDLGWRWTMYAEAIIALFLAILCGICLPETYAPVLLKRKAQRLRKSSGDSRYWHPHEKEKIDIHNAVRKYFARPLVMLFTEPLVGWLALYASFTYSLIYLTLEVFPIVFYEKRGWSLIVSSLPFLGIFLGVLCAAFVNFANQPRYRRAVRENNGEAVPEARLPPLVVGGVLLSAGLFWFGWTAPPRYPWPLPVVASGLIAAGFNIVFQQCLNFLVDTYGPFGASAVSANTILRSILACAMPIAARPMFVNLGLGSAASILGAISCLALPVPFIFMKYGAALRKRSKFTSAGAV